MSACTSQPSHPSPLPSPSPPRSQRAILQLRPVLELVTPSSPRWEKTVVTCAAGDASFSVCLVSTLDASRIVVAGPPSKAQPKYVLGPLIADGGDVAQANVIQVPQARRGGWQVNIRLTPGASKAFSAATTKALQASYPRNEIAIVVRGQVVSAPQVAGVVTTGDIAIREATRREAGALVASLGP